MKMLYLLMLTYTDTITLGQPSFKGFNDNKYGNGFRSRQDSLWELNQLFLIFTFN